MPQTLTVLHAPIGGVASSLPEVASAVEAAARRALADAPGDARAISRDGMLSLALLHDAGEGDSGVHEAAWDALEAGTAAARAIGAPGLGDGLPVDAFPGTLRDTGIALAEIVLTERPVGPLVVLLAAGASLGLYNLPLARAFADPFTTPRLVESPSLRRGFIFEVHDLEQPRKRMFAAPAELHDLLATLAQSHRYLLKSIVTPEGGVAAVASTARRSDVLGTAGGGDMPVAIVRTGGDAPTVEELLGALRTPQVVRAPDGRIAPMLPTAVAFHVAGARLLEPVDLLARPEFEATHRKVRNVRELLRAQGPFAPRADGDAEDVPGGAEDAGRWSER